jgi:hypothetical protein
MVCSRCDSSRCDAEFGVCKLSVAVIELSDLMNCQL